MSYTEQTNRQFTIEVTTTALCNLNCTYCFEGEKVNKQRLGDKVVLVKQRIREVLASDWFAKNYDVLNISFWGGEPTLNGDLIVDVMNEFSNIDNVDFHIYTNAYDRKRLDKILDAVDTSKLQVQVSYDGKPINDIFRIVSTGKPTSTQVMANFRYLAERGIHVSLKSTIPTRSMKGLFKVWKEFEQLYEEMQSVSKNTYVSYSPTIDYVTDVKDENLGELIAMFRTEMLQIAAAEIEFFKKHKRHLMAWFNGNDIKGHCASGAHMLAIDVDGQTYACHGSLYSPNKADMRTSSIESESFVDDIAHHSGMYQEHIRDVSPICKGCVATTCMICPVASLDKSTKETFTDKWTDRWVNNMCGFYKTFGEIDRTVQSYLAGEIAPNVGPKGEN